jgi:hypothetical protein
MKHITTGIYKDTFHCEHYYPPFNKKGVIDRCVFCKREKEIISAESVFNKEAYLLGQKTEEPNKNPFFKNTNSWYNWNRGKNERLINKTKHTL